jgi:hypothetical protein
VEREEFTGFYAASYTCTSTAPTTPPPGGVEFSFTFTRGGSSHPLPLRQK